MFNIPRFFPNRDLPHFCVMTEVFNSDEVDRIKFFKKLMEFSPAKIGAQGEENPDIRKVDEASFFVDQNTHWIWQKVGDLYGMANYECFLYDIEYIETINYLIYRGADSSKYDAHRDNSLAGPYRRYDRKISAITMLSDPSEFEGGELQIDFESNGNYQTIELNKGDMVFFDSCLGHRVTPVTTGTREVLVSWVHGRIKL